MTEKTFRLVRNHEVPAYECAGWIKHDSLVGTHHGEWSTLMELDEEVVALISAVSALGDDVSHATNASFSGAA